MPTATAVNLDVPAFVDRLLAQALAQAASDVHLEPTADGYLLRQRVDGLLDDGRALDPATGRAALNRLMVMAQLLTYRLDVPQESRLEASLPGRDRPLDCRMAVMPTVHGLRGVLRLPAELHQPRRLDELGLSAQAHEGLVRFAAADAGLLLLTGPAGSGKTTTTYALLAHIAVACRGVSIVALEDPVERAIAGVTQIQVQPFGQLTYEWALRSILRQDPQVLMIGEIRDADTARPVMQAALSGHRLISSFHAADAGGAIARLLEMGVEPYQITSALFGVLSQRLVRLRRADGSGYRGRTAIAELALMTPALRQAVLVGSDASSMQQVVHQQDGFISMAQAGRELVQQGRTDTAEIQRVLPTI